MPRAPSHSSQLRRQQAIETLLELASERPPSQIRTAQISDRMGLSEATLFHHSPSKESLWLASLEHAIALAWQPIDTLLQLRRPRGALAREHRWPCSWQGLQLVQQQAAQCGPLQQRGAHPISQLIGEPVGRQGQGQGRGREGRLQLRQVFGAV